MYTFSFHYDNVENSYFTLPIAPSVYTTLVNNKNDTIDLINIGEVNILKSIGLREFKFNILLPKDNFLCNFQEFKEPIFYLNRFREFKENKKPVRFNITRKKPNGQDIFETNILVSFEDYTVEERAGEEGEFYVELNLKEYRKIDAKILEDTGEMDKNGNSLAIEEIQRSTKEPPKTYIVKNGDTLWKIAKLQLNNGSRYKEIAELNNISDVNKIYPGMILKLQ